MSDKSKPRITIPFKIQAADHLQVLIGHYSRQKAGIMARGGPNLSIFVDPWHCGRFAFVFGSCKIRHGFQENISTDWHAHDGRTKIKVATTHWGSICYYKEPNVFGYYHCSR